MDILGLTIRKIGNEYKHCIKVIYWSNKVLRKKCTAINVAHRIYGPSPTPDSVPIIVLHGCLESKRNWEKMCNCITASTNKTVIAVDARNYGDSPYTPDHDYHSLTADVSNLMAKFCIERSMIIGHCMGGKTGMVLALTEPSKVERLIVVDTSPVSKSVSIEVEYSKVMEAMSTIDLKGMNLQKALDFARSKMLKLKLFHSEHELQTILINIGKLADKSIGWRYNLQTLKNTTDVINSFPDMFGKTYNGPTLFVAGRMSYALPPDDLKGIRKLFPAAYAIYIEGVGHNVHEEDPDAFFSAISQFLFHKPKIHKI